MLLYNSDRNDSNIIAISKESSQQHPMFWAVQQLIIPKQNIVLTMQTHFVMYKLVDVGSLECLHNIAISFMMYVVVAHLHAIIPLLILHLFQVQASA